MDFSYVFVSIIAGYFGGLMGSYMYQRKQRHDALQKWNEAIPVKDD